MEDSMPGAWHGTGIPPRLPSLEKGKACGALSGGCRGTPWIGGDLTTRASILDRWFVDHR
jgi:hypothetical protein